MDAQRDVLADKEWERISREFWAAREPGADEVTITVRRGGKMVRFVLLPLDGPSVTLLPDASA